MNAPGRLAGPRVDGLVLSPRRHKWILVVHIVGSVALVGDTAAILVLGVVAAGTSDPQLARASYHFMRMLIPMLGMPLTAIALATGLYLARGAPGGGLGRFWVRAKLLLVLMVIAIGALVLAPVAFPSGQDGGAVRAVVGSGLDVAALLTAVWFAVFKPDRRRARLPASPGT